MIQWNTTTPALKNLPQHWLTLKKERVEVLSKQFLMQHRYFPKTCVMLTEKQKNQVLKFIISGKGFIPYEKTGAIDAL